MPILHKHRVQKVSSEYPEFDRWLSEDMGLTVSADGMWSFRGTERKPLHDLSMLAELREKIGFDYVCALPTDPLIIVVDSKPTPTAFVTSLAHMELAPGVIALYLFIECSGHGQPVIRLYYDAAVVNL